MKNNSHKISILIKNPISVNPRKYLYHAYLSFMEARGHQRLTTLTAFGRAVPQVLKEYEIEFMKRKTNQGIQTNLTLKDDSETDWLPKCETK